MTIKKVKGLPERRERIKRTVKQTAYVLDTIMAVNSKYGKLKFTNEEYVSNYSARSALNHHAIDKGYPLKFAIRNGDLYFIRLDM